MINFKSFAAILLFSMFSLIIISCGEEPQIEEIIRPVRYQQVFSTGGSRIRYFTGVAQAGMESRLSFKVPGTVNRVAVQVGDKINAGSILAELDHKDYQLKFQQADAALIQSRAQARNVDANYERVRALYENNNASKSDLDAARSASESVNAAVSSAEKQKELARLQQSYTRLTAPVSGAIAQVNVEVNENVGAGQPIVVFTAGSEIEVMLSIPEVLISKMIEGSKVTVAFDAIPNNEYPATILEVGVAATGAGTTFPVTVRLDEKVEAVRPGMAATVACRFDSKDERERFIVPSHAVVEDRDGRFVYVVEPISDETEFGIIYRKTVTIGELTADGLEIFEGLSDGEMVVTAGVSRINEGLKVKI